MKIIKGIAVFFLVIIAISSLSISIDASDNKEPVAIYPQSELTDSPENKLREARGSRYGMRVPLEDHGDGIENLPINRRHFQGVREERVCQSDTVLIGEVIDVQAYVVGNRTNVYSEFSVRVEEIIKAKNANPIKIGDIIITDKWGGAVQFPSGRIQRYRYHNEGFPHFGQRYLVFLKHYEKEQDYALHTGFELKNGRVIPLDNLDERFLPFLLFRNSGEMEFLNAVRQTTQTEE